MKYIPWSVIMLMSLQLHGQKLDVRTSGVELTQEVQIQFKRHIEFQNNFYFEMFGSRVERDINALVIADTIQFDYFYKKAFPEERRTPEKTPAFYWPKTDLIYIYYQNDEELISSFAHELSHFMFMDRCKSIDETYWIDEGMAEYFAQLRITEHGDPIQNITRDYSELKSLKAKRRHIRDLIDKGYTLDFYEDMYEFGTAMSEYIFEQYREEVKLFYDALCEENPVTPLLKKKLGKGYNKFIQGFKSYFPPN